MKIDLSGKIAESLTNSGIITTEDKELYEYGLHHGLLMIINLLTTVVIGLLFKMVWQSFVFMLAYIPLRTYAGGYHAKTQFRCYLLSIVIMLAALFGIKQIPWTSSIGIGLTLCAVGIILYLSPVEDKNKPLNQVEVKVYGNRARLILFIEIVVMLVMIVLKQQQVAYCIAAEFVALSIMLILGFMKNKRLVKKLVSK